MSEIVMIRLAGQVRGGKNNVIVTRSGKRFPNPIFEQWRNKAVLEVKQQLSSSKFDVPCHVHVQYTPGDRRRRDVPAIMDGLWHVLERAGVVSDDKFLEDITWHTLPVIKDCGECTLVITPKKNV